MDEDRRIRWQADYLTGAKLYFIKSRKLSDRLDHEHCEFCWATFSEFDGDLHEGYCTEPTGKAAYWICPECYNDFKEKFDWKLGVQEHKK